MAAVSLHGHKRPPRRSEANDDEQDVSKGLLGDCLLNSEVCELLLQARSYHLQAGVEIDKNPIFEASLKYAQRFNNFNKDDVRKVRGLLSEKNLSDFELVTIANLDLSYKEALAFLPSLQTRINQPLEDDDGQDYQPTSDASDGLMALLASLAEYRGKA